MNVNSIRTLATVVFTTTVPVCAFRATATAFLVCRSQPMIVPVAPADRTVTCPSITDETADEPTAPVKVAAMFPVSVVVPTRILIVGVAAFVPACVQAAANTNVVPAISSFAEHV